MWNSRKYAAMAIAGAGLAVAAATPASAWWPGYYGAAYGSVGCGSYYGAAVGPGSIGCGDYGYAGTFGYGWPYNTYVGISDFGAYGGVYGAAPAYGWGYGYSPAYGFGGTYGYAPAYGYGYSYAPAYGFGCGRGHRAHGSGYVTAHQGHRPDTFAYAPASGLRVAAAKHHDVATKPVQSRVGSRANMKLARTD